MRKRIEKYFFPKISNEIINIEKNDIFNIFKNYFKIFINFLRKTYVLHTSIVFLVVI